MSVPLLSMESFTATEHPGQTFSQVVFTDIPYSYSPSTPVTCCFTLTAAFQPNPRDWVGIFKVGWSTTKDYHTFVWVEPCVDVAGQQSVVRQAVFRDYYLPKDEIEFYQFCYVDSKGQVRGASTPFCFRNSAEQSMESSPDDDLLVITTQEQVEQSVREKTELQTELEHIRVENETLKSALQMERKEAAILKVRLSHLSQRLRDNGHHLLISEHNEQKEKEKTELIKEMDQIKEQNENNIQQLQREMERLKEEMLIQMTKQMEIHQHNDELRKKSQSLTEVGESRQKEARSQEKYDRAVVKINQLKEEREELKGKIDAQSAEISKLNAKLREEQRELLNKTDSIQLLQVDLQSSEKEKERVSAELQRLQSLAHNMDDTKRENQELRRRLSEQETLQNCPDEDLRVRCQTLTSQLHDVQEKLVAEKEETRNNRIRAEYLERDLQHIKVQLENVISALDEEKRKSSKQELLLREAHAAIADKDSTLEEMEDRINLVQQEKDGLARENQSLVNDIKGLRRLCADLQAAPPADSPHSQPESTTSPSHHEWQQSEPLEQVENLYETIGSGADQEEEHSLVCRHCQEVFPCITRHELEQHEQSHRVCPFCTMICDHMEQSVFEDHVYSHEV
ncbi:hypothetical protein L3Q82_010552 [Scortum barcoo]|uniref:Uncharacterized protein n=1 Tax=Scortum barcoo TaxID=214431 RepID=A0ACB8WCS2_9TELE|nr:hypothetical protein L3Q82_010552 [Scortum barcoo]